MNGSFVPGDLRARVRRFAEPAARGFGRLGLTPNHLTFIGFGIACIAAVAAAQQQWLAAGLLVLFGGVFDLFDGALARATNKVSKLGAFYDSVFDRWGEGVVYVGIAAGSIQAGFGQGAILATAALASAVMVSYVRAKSESLGFTTGTGMANIGLAPREVRIAILAVAVVLTGLNGGVGQSPTTLELRTIGLPLGLWIPANYGQEYLTIGLGFIAILGTITTIQRILHVRAQAREG